MSIVLIEQEINGVIPEWFEYCNLSQEQWIKRIEKVVERFFSDLDVHPIYILFCDFTKNNNCFKYQGVFDAFINNYSKNIYIDTAKNFSLKHIAKVLSHELRHYQQIINGELSTEMQAEFASKNEGSTNYNNSPWEMDALNYENEICERVYNLFIEKEF